MTHDTKMNDDNIDMNDDTAMSQEQRERLQKAMQDDSDNDMADKKAM